MSATRDKSAGIAYSTTNIYSLYKKAKLANGVIKDELKPSDEKLSNNMNSRVIHGEDLGNVKIARFHPQKLVQNDAPSTDPEYLARNARSLEELKTNIEKIKDLQARLRFMLGELDALVGKKK